MFNKSEEIYDLVYSFKDYKNEALKVKDYILENEPSCKTILDIGCGTAEHHKYLSKDFLIDGIDINEKFVSIAKKKNPAGTYSVADMTSFDLQKKYDAVICLFSSIGYLKSFDEIVSALKYFSRHLNPQGLLIIEPWLSAEAYHSGKIGMTSYNKDDIKICRMSESLQDGNTSILNLHYMLATKDNGIQYFEESHKMRLTETEEMMKAFEIAGFDMVFLDKEFNDRGLYIGKKHG
jgi:ubiquinone/menaquinone biosynthesis C-methylase UbiE